MKAAATALVPQMREALRAQMAVTIADAIQSLLDDGLEAANHAQAEEERGLIIKALDHVAQHRRALAQDYERHLLAIHDEKIGWMSEVRDDASQRGAFGQFTLLDETVLAQQLALKKLVQKTLEELDRGELSGVEVRLRELFATSIDGARDPLGPGTPLKAAQRACAEGLDDLAAQLALVNMLQPHLAAGLRALYVQLNTLLIGAGVRPDYRPAIERDSSGRHVSRRSSAGVSISQVMSLRELLPGGDASPVDLRQILAVLLAGSTAGLHNGARVLADSEGHLYDSVMHTPVGAPLLERLHALQQLPGSEHDAGVAGAPDTAALRGVSEQMDSATDHPLDQLTAELVTVVFDFLLGDRELSPAVKEEIGRLQIVALKAALLDRSFFARREHPMRALLDEIVAVAVDPALDTDRQSPFVRGLHGVADMLTANFDADLSVFENAAAQLRALMADIAQDNERALAATTAELLAEERAAQREAQVLQQAAEAVSACVDARTPTFLRDFLQRHWVAVLAAARLQHADGDALWQTRLDTAQALVASVRARSRQEIPAYVAALPALVREVQAGMRAIDLPADVVQPFMNALMDTHKAIMQARFVAPSVAAAASPADAGALRVPIEAPARPMLPLAALQRGARAEFVTGDTVELARLLWASPAHTRYVFGFSSGRSRVMQDAELADELAAGRVRLSAARANALERAFAATLGDADVRGEGATL